MTDTSSNYRAVLQLARTTMDQVDPKCSPQFSTIILFLLHQPDFASTLRGRNPATFPSSAYITKKAQDFASGRAPQAPGVPKTIQDQVVSEILRHYFNVPSHELRRAEELHRLSMAAENMIGNLLERYLASVMEPRGYVWCAGSIVRAVDFVKPPVSSGGDWTLLQVKNRDNSENSSSASVRKGTSINKWFRSFSAQDRTNWGAFPDLELRPSVSESGFRAFVSSFLRDQRAGLQ